MLLMVIRTTLIYVFVLFIMRFMGKRQLGELHASELVSTMIISNLASISIEQQSIPILVGIIPVLIIATLEIIMSGIIGRNAKFERFIEGQPKVIILNGKLVQSTLQLLRFTVTDVLSALRDKSIFDPTAVSVALVEPNGNLTAYSVDAGPKSPKDSPPATVIVDGVMVRDALEICGKTQEWLNGYLQACALDYSQILLMMVYSNGSVHLVKYESK